MNSTPDIEYLVVNLERAADLKSTDWFKKQDPYCILRCGGSKHRSMTIKRGGCDPVWKEEITLPIRSRDDCLEVEIWDEDRLSKDDLIGTVTVSLKQARQRGCTQLEMPVYTKKSVFSKKLILQGTLFMGVEVKNASLETVTQNGAIYGARPSATAAASTSYVHHGRKSGHGHSPRHHHVQTHQHSPRHQPAQTQHYSSRHQPAPTQQHSPRHQPAQTQHHSLRDQPAPTQHHSSRHQPPPIQTHSPRHAPAPTQHHSPRHQPAPTQHTSTGPTLSAWQSTEPELQEHLKYLTAQLDATQHQILHNYQTLRQYADNRVAEERKWFQNLEKAFAEGIQRFEWLNQEIDGIKDRLKTQFLSPAGPHPQPANHASHQALPQSTKSHGNKSATTPGPQQHSTAALSPRRHSSPTPHTGTSDGRHRAHSGSHNHHNRLPLRTYGSGSSCGIKAQKQFGAPSNFTFDKHAPPPSPQGSGAILAGDSCFISSGSSGLWSGHSEGSAASKQLSQSLPTGQSQEPGVASWAVFQSYAVQQRWEARWRAIQRWKSFMTYVRINYLYVNKQKNSVLLDESQVSKAGLPTPPPPPQARRGAKSGTQDAAAVSGLKTAVWHELHAAFDREDSDVSDDLFGGDQDGLIQDPQCGERWHHMDRLQVHAVGRQMGVVDEGGMVGRQGGAVRADVQRHRDMILDLGAKIKSVHCGTMDELCTFVDYVDSELDVMLDVPAVLKHFPEWPEAKFETMREAAYLYRVRLGSKIRDMAQWQAPANANQAAMQSRMIVDNACQTLRRLAPEKANTEQRFQDHGLPWDRKIWSQVNMAALKLCAQQLRIALHAVRQPTDLTHKQCVDLLQASLDMHYKVYRMAGGYNREVQQLSQEAFAVWQKLTTSNDE